MDLTKKMEGVLGMAAIGDAMGSVTENLTFDQIREMFGGGLTAFAKPGKTAFALGNEAGEITDDFSQTYLICKEVVANDGALTCDVAIDALIKWSEVHKWCDRFAGPTTRTAIAMYKDPSKTMKPLPGAVTVDYASKATNGAAMKISPAGLLHPNDIEGAIDAAVTIARVTHDNSLAISGACAVAACVSAALAPGATMRDALGAALYGAMRGETIGRQVSHDIAGASVVERIRLADSVVRGGGTKDEKLRRISQLVGSGIQINEAVPCAFALAELNEGDALQATIDAVNIGYDTDTVADITGAMVGAFADFDDPRFCSLYQQVQEANGISIAELASQLNELVCR